MFDYGVFGVSDTFFIDGQGSVVAKVIGHVDIGSPPADLDAILRGARPRASTGWATSRSPST